MHVRSCGYRHSLLNTITAVRVRASVTCQHADVRLHAACRRAAVPSRLQRLGRQGCTLGHIIASQCMHASIEAEDSASGKGHAAWSGLTAPATQEVLNRSASCLLPEKFAKKRRRAMQETETEIAQCSCQVRTMAAQGQGWPEGRLCMRVLQSWRVLHWCREHESDCVAVLTIGEPTPMRKQFLGVRFLGAWPGSAAIKQCSIQAVQGSAGAVAAGMSQSEAAMCDHSG